MATMMSAAGPYEQLAGRLLALCANPIAAWRLVSIGERSLMVLTYFSAGYVIALGALLLW